MKAQASALLFIACLWTSQAQSDSTRRNIWDDPIKFSTKGKDSCIMHVTGQGDYTKLRVSCKNEARSYWCDFQGKPNLCRSYSNNPRHYFTQIMWDLRKLNNACQEPRALKPIMCKKATDEAKMVFTNSWPRPVTPKPVKTTYERPPYQTKPETAKSVTQKPASYKPYQGQVKPVTKVTPQKKTTPKSTKMTITMPTENTVGQATILAQQYCWKPFQGVCAFFISWFLN